jgi:hypothetical protein
MALYKYPAYVSQNANEIFDEICTPGTPAPRAGIFRCMGCHREVALNEEELLPPQNHHEHEPAQGDVRWRLTVYANHRPQ